MEIELFIIIVIDSTDSLTKDVYNKRFT